MDRAIGVLDSGVGGLSVAAEIFKNLPYESLLYYADTYNLPYGEKSVEQIQNIVLGILDHFMENNVKAVVMACNTSTALVLDIARKKYPIPIIGVIEAAVVEAVNSNHGSNIGIFANQATIASMAHKKRIAALSSGRIDAVGVACPKLVPLVERGATTGREADEAILEYLAPIQEAGCKQLILGCTHYPFLEETIRKHAGEWLQIINPARETALELKRVLNDFGIEATGKSPIHAFHVSGDPEQFSKTAQQLLGRELENVTHIKIAQLV